MNLCCGVLGEHDVPDRSRAARVLGVERLLHELAVRLEDLQPVVGAVAHVDEPVVRALDAVHRVAELLRGRRRGIVRAEVGVVRLVAVGAPVALHLAGVGVEHGDALVEIAVRDIGFVGFRIDPDLGDAAEILQVVAAAVLAEVADLHQELAVLGEFEDVGVLLAVAADPDVAFVVDMDAVVGLRPLVARPGPPQDRTRLPSGSNTRTGGAVRQHSAIGGLSSAPLLIVVEPAGAAMDDPDIVLLVDPHADRPAQQPIVGKRLRPERIDLEHAGPITLDPCASAWRCKSAWPTPSPGGKNFFFFFL